MNQLQFEMIMKVIQNGAPALADELCGALANLVNDRNKLAEENKQMKKEKEDAQSEPTEAPTPDEKK